MNPSLPAGVFSPRRKRPSIWLLLPVLFLVGLSLLPLVYVGTKAWQAGWAEAVHLLWRPYVFGLLRNTLALMIGVTVACGVIGLSLAWLLERSNLPGRRIWGVILCLPFAVPAFVSSFTWVSLSANFEGLGGAILVMTLSKYPLVFLPVAATLRNLDPSLEESARTLGLNRWGVFFRITLPLLWPSLLAGALLIALHMLVEFGALSIIGLQTFTTAIYQQFELEFSNANAAMLSAVLLVMCLTLLWLELRVRVKAGDDIAVACAAYTGARDQWRTRNGRLSGEHGGRELPSREAVAQILESLCGALFPMRLGPVDLREESEDFYVGHTLDVALNALLAQARLELRYAARQGGQDDSAVDAHAIRLIQDFALALPSLRSLLDTDVLAAYHGDPAARSVDEVLLCYPGILAVIHHRLAHHLYRAGLPLLARISAEIAHSATGIDIHPGAQIGPSFFIDHGTGVVIGETAIIGERVRIYQAVTLGANNGKPERYRWCARRW